MQDVRASLRQYGGIVASRAAIEHGVPASSGHVIDNSTLVLVDPKRITSADALPKTGFLIVPREPWVVGQIDVAGKTKSELQLTTNVHALLPAEVEVLEIIAPDHVKHLASGRINYIRIETDAP